MDDERRGVRRARSLSRLLDSAFRVPGTGRTVGFDPIIGLLPVAGDAVSLVLSSYVIFEGIRAGLPLATLARMVFNVLLETVVGSVPVVGDLFDAFWKANERNVELLEERAETPEGDKDKVYLLGVGFVTVFVLLSLVALLVTALAVLVVAGSRLLT
ncbi:MAG: DUF4112 domain-containing protein [Halobacteria archaeon]|nr:DUF4112 domain-containing protein [Halobacteria archaeon]